MAIGVSPSSCWWWRWFPGQLVGCGHPRSGRPRSRQAARPRRSRPACRLRSWWRARGTCAARSRGGRQRCGRPRRTRRTRPRRRPRRTALCRAQRRPCRCSSGGLRPERVGVHGSSGVASSGVDVVVPGLVHREGVHRERDGSDVDFADVVRFETERPQEVEDHYLALDRVHQIDAKLYILYVTVGVTEWAIVTSPVDGSTCEGLMWMTFDVPFVTVTVYWSEGS